MLLFVLLVVIFLGLTLYYIVGKYNKYYWKKRGVVFYEKHEVGGPYWEFLSSDRATFECFHDVYKTHPNEPAVGLGTLLTPLLYVRDPKNVLHVLQTDFRNFSHRGVDFAEKDLLTDHILFQNGNRWKIMRQVMSPLFTNNKLKTMHYIVDKSAQDFVKYLKDNPTEQKGDSLFNALNKFCGAAIGAAVFGITTKSVFDSPFVKMAKSAMAPGTSRKLKFALSGVWFDALKKLNLKLFGRFEDFFIGTIKQVIRQRENEKLRRHDFADMCVTLQKNGTIKDPVTGYELEPTDEVLAAQAFFYYLAGVEPTALTLYATFLELGRNPEVLKKLNNEIDDILKKHNGEITFEAINEMLYLDQVFNEALRMYPPIGFTTRLCVHDSVLPVGNIKVEAGTKIITPIFELHHDSNYFSDPDVFDPNRFSPENKYQFDNIFMPFGKGGRTCIGMRYATLQAKAGIVHVLRHFTVKTKVLPGGIKYSRELIQVRPINVDVHLIEK